MKNVDYMFVYEFPVRADDTMMSDVVCCLRRRGKTVAYIHGFLKRYRPGGLSLLRVANLFWVYLRLAVLRLTVRPSTLVVRTSPPAVQLWAAILFGSTKTYMHCWLMDYHPEIEARFLESINMAGLAKLTRQLDKSLLGRFHSITVLDLAMKREVVRRIASENRVHIYPTWGAARLEESKRDAKIAKKCLTFIYAGNLGYSHEIKALSKLLSAVQIMKPVILISLGCSPDGEKRFLSVARSAGVRYIARSRVAFKDLSVTFKECNADYGVVLLGDKSGGVVSPSKYLGYLEGGIPIVYIGPEDTNADLCISYFGAGVALRNAATSAELAEAASKIMDLGETNDLHNSVVAARDHFRRFGGDNFTDHIEKLVARCKDRETVVECDKNADK